MHGLSNNHQWSFTPLTQWDSVGDCVTVKQSNIWTVFILHPGSMETKELLGMWSMIVSTRVKQKYKDTNIFHADTLSQYPTVWFIDSK